MLLNDKQGNVDVSSSLKWNPAPEILQLSDEEVRAMNSTRLNRSRQKPYGMFRTYWGAGFALFFWLLVAAVVMTIGFGLFTWISQW